MKFIKDNAAVITLVLVALIFLGANWNTVKAKVDGSEPKNTNPATLPAA